jgi:hypothetical protein
MQTAFQRHHIANEAYGNWLAQKWLWSLPRLALFEATQREREAGTQNQKRNTPEQRRKRLCSGQF